MPTKSLKRSPRKTAATKKSAELRIPPCFDDPQRMASRAFRVCVNAVSKDLRDGTLRRARVPGAGIMRCVKPDCTTLKTVHRLLLKTIIPHEECDSPLSLALQIDQSTGAGPQGALLVEPLVTVFEGNGLRRGIHAGNFLWRGPNFLRIRGRMSGTTNAGLYRAPVFDEVERCSQVHVLYGRLCGRIETIDAAGLGHLVGSQLIGTYRIAIQADPGEGERGLPGSDRVEGVLEAAILSSCR